MTAPNSPAAHGQLPPLDRECEVCAGQGMVASQAWIDWWNRVDDREKTGQTRSEAIAAYDAAFHREGRRPTDGGAR